MGFETNETDFYLILVVSTCFNQPHTTAISSYLNIIPMKNIGISCNSINEEWTVFLCPRLAALLIDKIVINRRFFLFSTLQNVAPHKDISLVVFDYQLSQLFGIIWLIAEYQIFRIYVYVINFDYQLWLSTSINVYQRLSTSINIYKPIHNYPSDLECQGFLPKKERAASKASHHLDARTIPGVRQLGVSWCVWIYLGKL